jgi:hypothetical protein
MRASRRKRQSAPERVNGVAELEDSPELQRPVVYVNPDIVWERGDVGFWNPRWFELEPILRQCPYPVRPLGEFIPETVERGGSEVLGITHGQAGRREYPPQGTLVVHQNGSVKLLLPRAQEAVDGVLYLQVKNLTRTGIDPTKTPEDKRYIQENSYNDPSRSRLWVGDIVLVNSGVGSLGRTIVFTDQYSYSKVNISQHLTKFTVQDILPEWCCVYLQSMYGAHQMIREASGVSGQTYIDYEELKNIFVVVPDESIQQAFAQGYRSVVDYHLKAVDAKANQQSDGEADKLMNTAVGILEMLIWQAENLIEGSLPKPLSVFPRNLSPALISLLEDEYARVGQMVRNRDTTPDCYELQSRALGIHLERDGEIKEAIGHLARLLAGLEELSLETR